MRHVCAAAAKWISLIPLLVIAPVQPAMGAGPASGLAVDANYQFVDQVRFTRTQWYVTYRAELANTGAALPNAVATLTSVSPNVIVVPGQDTVHFGPVPADGTAVSSDTFTILVDRSVTFSWSNVQWSIQSVKADAGENRTVQLNSKVFLNGSASTNPAGAGTLSYSWSFVSTPTGSNAQLSNPASVFPSFVADTAGQYVVALTVSNGFSSSTANVTISTEHSLPVANAGPNQTVPLNQAVTLDGSRSYDVDGNPLSYAWSLISVPTNSVATLGDTSASVTPTFVPDLAGVYVAQLIVTDANGSSIPSTVVITTGNTAPVANAGLDQIVTPGAMVQLNGAGSTDVNGNPLTYQWSLISLPSGSGAALSDPTAVNPTFVADLAGTYVAQLIVNDGKVNSSPATVVISTNATLPPTANAGPPQSVPVGAKVTLSGWGIDPQSLPLSFHWSLIAKPAGSIAALANATAQSPTFIADQPGTYVAQLITNNGYEDSAPSTVTINTGITAPVALAGKNESVPSGTLVNLNGSASYDPENNPLTYSWALLHVPANSTAILSNPTATSPTFLADVSGTYVAQLIVNNGSISSAPVTVTVNASVMKVTLSPSPLRLLLNAPGTLTINLTQPAPSGGLQVNLSGFDPTVISLAAMVTVPANQTSATVMVTPLAPGTTSILASAAGNQPGSVSVSVTTPGITVTLPAGVGIGHTATGTVTLSAPAPAAGTVVSLNSTSDATVNPTTVTIGSNSTSGSFTITGVSSGTATITATATNFTPGTGSLLVSQLGAIGLSPATVAPGQTISFPVTLSSPAPPGGETITLISSDPTKLTVTSPVVIPQGATKPTTEPTITGVAFGSATVTASGPGYVSASQIVQVSAVLSFTPNSSTIGTGGSQNLTLSISSASSSAIVVSLSSTNPSVAKVPASVTIAANTTSVTVPVTAGTTGAATITASTTTPNIGNGTASITVTTFGGITVPPTLSVGLGQSSTLTISLSSAAPQGGVTVTLSSNDPTKATVSPSSVFIPAGQTQPAVQPQVTGTGPGSTTITATAPGFVSASIAVQTTASLSLTPQNITLPNSGTQLVTVTLSGPAPSAGLVVNLTTTTANVISMPSQVTIQPNATFATFTISAVGTGSTTLSASASVPNVASANDQITVLTAQAIILPANVTVAPGQSMAFPVTLPTAPTAAVTVTLASSDPSKVTISPSTVTIAAGQTTPAAQPQVTGVNFGSATITAAASGYGTGSQSVKVAASLSFSTNSTTITGTTTANLTLQLSAPAAGALTISLSASPTGIVTLPATVTIAQNASSVSVPVTGANIGSTTITASTTAPNVASATTGVTVSSSGSISLPSGASVGLGQSAAFPVTLSSAAPAGGTTVMLSSSNSSVVSISPTSVLIPAGATQPATAPRITGVAPGSATISASAATYTSAAQSVAVTASLALTPQTPSIAVGQSQNLTLTLSGAAPAGGLTFTVISSNPAAATVSSPVTIAAGSTTATIPVTAVAAGTTTITASAPNITSASDVVTVTPAVSIIVPANVTVGPGANVTFPVTLATAPKANVTVTLTLSNPALASLNFTSVSFNAGSTTPTRQPLLTGISSGSLTITASSPGLTNAVSQVTVGSTASFSPTSLTIIGTTGTGSLYINLSSPAVTTTTFNLVSSNPSVATVPGTARISASAQTVGFSVTPLSYGTTTITATATGFAPITATVTVAKNPPLTLSVSNSSLQLGGAATVTVGIPSPAQSGPVSVTLTSSNPNVVVAPTTVTILQNASSATAQITGINVGSANIGASATNYASPTPVPVQVGASVSWSAPTLTITGNGKVGYLNLVLSAPVPAGSSGVSIALSSSNTAAATVPASVVFPVNSSAHPTVQVAITSVAPGTTTIHASGTNIPDATATVTVVGPLTITTTSLPNGAVGSGYSATVNANGGVSPYTFSATGLPANLSINSTTGQITGTPQAQGSSSVTVKVTDSSTPTPVSVSATFTLVVNAAAPASITAASGTPQSAQLGAAFASPLVALVKDSSGNPVSGASVTFTAPASGASGVFPGGVLTYTASTNASGLATSAVFTANSTQGSYSVLASVSGVATPASFALTNVQRAAASVTASGGTPQTTAVGTAFPASLTAIVKDSLGNPISGIVVTFTAPTSGASATFLGGVTTITSATNASGMAAVGVTANTIAGSYIVTATVSGVATPATFSLTNTAGTAASIAATAGSNQSAQEKSAFATALAATVKDKYGNPVSGASVVFNAPTSGASGTFANGTTTTSATTNSSGVATAATFTANSSSGSYNVTATTSGVSTPATFALTNLTGAPGSIKATAGTPQATTVNTAFGTALAATVKDANNNPVPNVTVTFTVTPASSGAGASFSGGTTTATAVTNGSGVATIALTANKVAGSYSVSASTSGVSTPAVFLLTNNAGAAASIVATSGSGQTASISTAFAAPLVATVKDQYGNAVNGASVTFTIVSSGGAGGTFAGGGTTNTVTTNSSGAATSSTITANGTKGSYSATASVSGVSTPATFTLTNAAGAAASIVASSSSTPQSATVNTAFGSALIVTVKDSGGNPVSGATVTFTAPSTGASGSFAGSGAVDTVTTNASGVATSTTFTANTTAGSYSVTAATGSVSTTFALTNKPGAVASVSASSGSGQSAIVNTAYASPLKAVVKDTYGNTISGVTVTFTAPATGASATFAGSVTSATTDSTGTATSAILTANSIAGPFSVTAASGSASTTFSLTNKPGSPASITVTGGSGQSATVNTAFLNPLTAVLKDAQGNLIPGASVVFTAPATGASGVFTGGTNTITVTTNASGVATAPTLTANKTAGAYTVTAAINSLSAPFSLTNVAGPAAAITATAGSNQSAAVSTAFATNLQATVADASGNPISGVAVTFTAPTGTTIATGTFAGGSASTTVSTNSSGVATAPVFTANSVAGSYAVKAAVNTSITTTFNLQNTAAGPANITVVSGSGQTAQVNATFAAPLQAKVTDAGNNGLRGIQVTFTAPVTDTVPSGTFANGTNTVTVTTDSNGLATTSAFTANGTVGSYGVVASVSGLKPTATFTLTNSAGGVGGTITATNVTVGANLEANIVVTLNPPAPSTGLCLSYGSSNASQLLVGSSSTLAGKPAVNCDPNTQSPNIPAGTQQFSIVAQALVSSGKATVTFAAPGYVSGVSTVTFAPSGFVIGGPNGVGAAFNAFKGSSTSLTVYSGYLDTANTIAANQSVAGGLSIVVPVSSSNTSVGTVSPSSATFTGGVGQANVSLNASSTNTGSTTVSVTQPAGSTAPTSGTSVTATIQQANIIPFSTTLGDGLQQTETISLSGPAPVATNVTLTSPDSRVQFYCGSTGVTACSCSTTTGQACTAPVQAITLTIAPGHSISPNFLVEGSGSSGTVSYTASASGFGTTNGSVTLAPAVLVIQSPGGFGAPSFSAPLNAGPATLTFYTGYNSTSLGFVAQNVADGNTVSISLSNSKPSVATLSPTSLTIAAENGSATATLTPETTGSTNVTANATASSPAQTLPAAQVAATFNQVNTYLSISGDNTTIGNQLASPYSVYLSTAAGSSGESVTITSNSPAVLLAATPAGPGSTTLTLTVPASGLTASFYVIGASNTGSATLTASGSGYANGTASVTLAPASFVVIPPQLSGSAGSSTDAQVYAVWLDNTNSPNYSDEVLSGTAGVNIPVTSSNTSVATVSSPLTFGAGQNSILLPINLVATGNSTVTISEPSGFGQPAQTGDLSTSVQVQ